MNKVIAYIKSHVFHTATHVGALCALIAFTTSCSLVNEDMSECPRGVTVRFVYDYNMERANAFPSQVDCVTLYIFDQSWHLLEKFSETSEILSNENYRMEIDIPEGSYHFLALAGNSCEKNSFEVTHLQNSDERSSLQMRLPLRENKISDNRLHDLFFGETEQIYIPKDQITEVTIYMIKDTNSVQIALQELEAPYSIDIKDYDFLLEADNELLGYDNATVPMGGMFYHPHTAENRLAGYVSSMGSVVDPDESQMVQVGIAEFNISRLMLENSPNSYIVVRKKGSDEELIRVPMIDYMVMSRHSGHDWIASDQEYLDRQSTWNFMFFLQNGRWIQARVAVNNWILRFNHAVI